MADPLTRKQFAAKLKEKYPQYASVPDDQLVDAVVAKYPQYKASIIDKGNIPPGVISTGPHGLDWVKAKLYQARNAGVNNLDTAGGVAGGLLGVEGGPPGMAAGAALGGGAGRAATQLIHTAQGKPMEDSWEAAKDIGLGGLEQGGLELAGLGIGKLGKMIKPTGREAYLAYGAKAGELGPKIEGLLPDLDKFASRVGKPKSVEEFGKLVDLTERGLNQEFNAALFPIAQNRVAANPVAAAIRSQITSNMDRTAEGRAMKAYLERRALEFDRAGWDIGSLNRERELITKRLKAYHNALATGQTAQARVHANMAADTAAEKALKDLLYDAADQSGAKPPGYFKALKQKQSDLISLSESVGKSAEKLTKASVERKGAPLSDKVHLRGFLHPTGVPGGAAGVSPTLFTDPLVQANKAISKGFPSGAKSAIRGVRNIAGTALSNPNIDALPLRIMTGDFSQEEPAQ